MIRRTIYSDFTGGDGTYHLKVLVPGVAAGAIIGKGGDTIAQLQKDTGARVKMSKSHDFYPGMLLCTRILGFIRLIIVSFVYYRNYRKSVSYHRHRRCYYGSHGIYHGQNTREA